MKDCISELEMYTVYDTRTTEFSKFKYLQPDNKSLRELKKYFFSNILSCLQIHITIRCEERLGYVENALLLFCFVFFFQNREQLNLI